MNKIIHSLRMQYISFSARGIFDAARNDFFYYLLPVEGYYGDEEKL